MQIKKYINNQLTKTNWYKIINSLKKKSLDKIVKFNKIKKPYCALIYKKKI